MRLEISYMRHRVDGRAVYLQDKGESLKFSLGYLITFFTGGFCSLVSLRERGA